MRNHLMLKKAKYDEFYIHSSDLKKIFLPTWNMIRMFSKVSKVPSRIARCSVKPTTRQRGTGRKFHSMFHEFRYIKCLGKLVNRNFNLFAFVQNRKG